MTAITKSSIIKTVIQRYKCPICTSEANKPLTDPDGVIILCYVCPKCLGIINKDIENGAIFDVDYISNLRRRLHLTSEIDGVQETYMYDRGKHWLMWVAAPGKLKVFINQYIDGEPEMVKKIEPTESFELSNDGETLTVRRTHKLGRPFNGVTDGVLLDLIFDQGMSYRDASRYLEIQGIAMSYEGIRKRMEDLKGAVRTK